MENNVKNKKDYSVLKEVSKNKQVIVASVIAVFILFASVYATFNSLVVRNGERKGIPDRLKQVLTPTTQQPTMSREEAENIVKSLPEVESYIKKDPKAVVEADRENVVNNSWIVHVYTVENLSRVTFDWYEIDKETKEVEKLPDTEFSPNPIANDGCVVSGCNSEICSDEEMVSTCEYKPIYQCYKSATCERQEDGKCGWTMDEGLTSCLEQYVSKPSI